MLVTILKPDFQFEDERGALTQLVHEGYNQINVVESKASAFRGGHYHKNNKEVFFVIRGEFKFTAEKDAEREEYTFKAGDMFLVPPYVAHGFDFSSDTLLIGLYDVGVENADGTKDIYAV